MKGATTLHWRRVHAGLYTCGNWIVERLDGQFPTWCLRYQDDGLVFVREYFKTLHKATAAANGIVRRELLLSYAQLSSAPIE